MHRTLAGLTATLALLGCEPLADQQSEGVALATIRGSLSLAREVAPPATSLHVSVLWRDPKFPSGNEPGGIATSSTDPITEGPCGDGQPVGWRVETTLLEQTVRVDTAFPAGFSVRLTEPPPPAALFAYEDGSGVSRAYGDLVVYEDGNGNGRLDPSTFTTKSPDIVYGSSQATAPWGIGQRKRYTIVYLTDDSEYSGDGKAGYSLETEEFNAFTSYTSSAQRLSDATIDLTLEPTTYVQQKACTIMCKANDLDIVEDPDTLLEGDLGTPLPSELEAGASAWSKQLGDTSVLTLRRCLKEPSPSGVGTRYSLELYVLKTQGCAETSSVLISVWAGPAGVTDADAKLPCPRYSKQTVMYPEIPTEPPSEPPMDP